MPKNLHQQTAALQIEPLVVWDKSIKKRLHNFFSIFCGTSIRFFATLGCINPPTDRAMCFIWKLASPDTREDIAGDNNF